MLALHILFLLLSCVSATIYDFSRSSVHALTSFNFDQQVTKQRIKFAGLIHFYRNYDRYYNSLIEEFDTFATRWQGAFVIGAVNCDEEEGLCEVQGVRQTPFLKVYPPLPGPTHEYEDQVTYKQFLSYMARYLGGKVEELTTINHDHFLDTKPATPKAILFTQKQGIPTIYRALSNTLGDTLDFGIVRSEQVGLVSKYNVASFPTLFVVKKGESKPHLYAGDLEYRALFEFLNIYSEVFDVSSSKKPWKSTLVPELRQESYIDVCFGKEGIVCVIFFTSSNPTQSFLDLFQSLQKKLKNSLKDKGPGVGFMWVNVVEETAFVDNFAGVEAPALVFLKPGNPSQFSILEEELTEVNIETALAKILDGYGKFTNIDKEFPRFNTQRIE